MLLSGRTKDLLNIEVFSSPSVDSLLERCAAIYAGQPYWLDPENNIKTINFAKTLCSETARLATLGIGINITGSARADWLQEQVKKLFPQLRHWVEYGCAYGTVILKPNGENVDLYTKGNFEITHKTGDIIDGAVFYHKEEVGKKYFVRLEHHGFADGVYTITNYCFVGDSEGSANRPVNIKDTPWGDLEESVSIANRARPLFAVLRMPAANNIDIDSPYALPIFAEAIEELKDLDVAYSRNVEEIDDSRKVVLLDSDRLLASGHKVNNSPQGFDRVREQLRLPKFVRNVMGNGRESFYQEINPFLNTEERLKGINSLLSQIGFKAGFSNGYFVFNEKTGMVTATQVESDDRRTIQTVGDVRGKLRGCTTDLIDALNGFADLYDLAPLGKYELVFDFGDITYNEDEDRARYWGYVLAGKFPFWKYLVKFEGYSEEEAKEIEAEAAPKSPTLFGGEE